ncbi:hypothetical protein [Aliivibrio fischeri]|uniref:hypothetical protein n=1 Tax=Aliivibrio fischeri TaxID=668 RepID=UPI0012D9F0C1|nr:hypothetical protein [Aliivibrio fischeri]MUK28406.1 hypothetical protein [Aliivibrio fischeri]MUK35946.1 hypothetical protein [Aliivibrio fischeri]
MIKKYSWIVAFFLSLIMLISHSLKLFEIQVDATSILLLVIILLSPHIASLTKIKYGDFEAEISRAEVEAIRDESPQVSTKPENSSGYKRSDEFYESINPIIPLAETDHVLALAKLRIEIEKVVKRYHRLTIKQPGFKSIGALLNELVADDRIEQQTAKSIRDIVAVCNRAIHGETITRSNADIVINSGVVILDDLFWDLEFKVAHGEVVSKEYIEPFDFEHLYYNKKYQLTTVGPSVDKPEKIVRILTQEQLDDLLEGYNEYAEFIVELKPVEENG